MGILGRVGGFRPILDGLICRQVNYKVHIPVEVGRCGVVGIGWQRLWVRLFRSAYGWRPGQHQRARCHPVVSRVFCDRSGVGGRAGEGLWLW